MCFFLHFCFCSHQCKFKLVCSSQIASKEVGHFTRGTSQVYMQFVGKQRQTYPLESFCYYSVFRTMLVYPQANNIDHLGTNMKIWVQMILQRQDKFKGTHCRELNPHGFSRSVTLVLPTTKKEKNIIYIIYVSLPVRTTMLRIRTQIQTGLTGFRCCSIKSQFQRPGWIFCLLHYYYQYAFKCGKKIGRDWDFSDQPRVHEAKMHAH